MFYKTIKLSKYRLNKTDKYVNLLERSNLADLNDSFGSDKNEKPITHLLTVLNVNTLDSMIDFDRNQIPQEFIADLRLTDKNEYLPILHIDNLSIKDADFKALNETQSNFSLTFVHSPASIGKLRFFKQLEGSMDALKEFGFNDDQLKEITSLFTETNLYLIFLTFLSLLST